MGALGAIGDGASLALSLAGDKGADTVIERIKRRNFRSTVADHLQNNDDLDGTIASREALAHLLDTDEFWDHLRNPDGDVSTRLADKYTKVGVTNEPAAQHRLAQAVEAAVIFAVYQTGTETERLDILLHLRTNDTLLQVVNYNQDLFAKLEELEELIRRFSAGSGSVPTAARRFGRPPLVVTDFRGRQDELDRLDQAERSVLTALHGLGGVGKTQLAARYFRDRHASFDYAAWIDMRDQDGLTDFARIADGLGLHIGGDEIATVVVNHLKASSGSWLLVFDNAESPTQLHPLIVQSPNVKTIVTSRYRSWGRWGTVIPIDVFDPDTAVQFLRDRAERPDDPDAEQLAQDLGHLPLALSLAGAYCNERRISFDHYRTQVLPADLTHAMSPDDPTTYDRTIGAIWLESLDAVINREPDCLAIIELASAIDWTDISRTWLAGRPLFDPIDLDRCLGLLATYSLIELSDTTVAITHNLIADGVGKNIGSARQGDLVALLEDALPLAAPDLATVTEAQEPLRHLHRLVRDHAKLISVGLTDTLLRASNQLNLQGSVTQDFHERAALVLSALLGPDHPDTLTGRANLAYGYRLAGRVDDAVTLSEEVDAVRTRVLGPDHHETLIGRANLTGAYYQAGRIDEAASLLEQVLADSRRVLGAGHQHTLTTRANLAVIYHASGRTRDAVSIFQQAVVDSRRAVGAEHPDTLTLQANLADSYRKGGDPQSALILLERVLVDCERVLGADHPDTIATRASLADSYGDVGRIDESIAILASVLDDRERLLGPDHPHTIVTRGNLAFTYHQAGRTNDAVTVGQRILEDSRRILGAEHADTIRARASLAHAYRQAGRTDEADRLEAG